MALSNGTRHLRACATATVQLARAGRRASPFTPISAAMASWGSAVSASAVNSSALRVVGGPSRAMHSSTAPSRYNNNLTPGETDLSTSVFVSNLPYNISSAELKDFLSAAGEVANVEIFNKDGVPTGSGVAEFHDAKSAKRAIDNLHDQICAGRMIMIRENRKPTTERNYQIVLTGLSDGIGWWDIKDLVKEYAAVLHVWRHRGRALIHLKHNEDVEMVIEELNSLSLAGRPIIASRVDRMSGLSHGFRDRLSSHQIQLENLPSGVTWHGVKDLLRQFGEPVHVQVDNGRATARMRRDEDAEVAIEALNGFVILGNTLVASNRLKASRQSLARSSSAAAAAAGASDGAAAAAAEAGTSNSDGALAYSDEEVFAIDADDDLVDDEGGLFSDSDVEDSDSDWPRK